MSIFRNHPKEVPGVDAAKAATAEQATQSLQAAENAIDQIIVLVFWHAIVPFAAVWHGFAFYVGWRWVIAPTFHLALLTFWQSVAVLFFWRFLVPGPTANSDPKGPNLGVQLTKILAGLAWRPVFYIGILWLIKLFLPS